MGPYGALDGGEEVPVDHGHRVAGRGDTAVQRCDGTLGQMVSELPAAQGRRRTIAVPWGEGGWGTSRPQALLS